MARRRTLRLAFAIVTIIAGLACRFAPLHLPWQVSKYGGSALYAILLYWLFAAALPHARTLTVALAATLTVTAIEFFKLVHTPALDAFRLTLPGKLLLGRIFSLRDLLAYFLAIAAIAITDSLRRSKTYGQSDQVARRKRSVPQRLKPR